MKELLYSATDIAWLIRKRNIKVQCGQTFISKIWEQEKEYLPARYRKNQKKWILDVLEQLGFEDNAAAYQKEIPLINRDLSETGSKTILSDSRSFSEIGSFFKELRLRVVLLEPKDYVRMKLRTMLREHGHKRRSRLLVEYMRKCLYFYHIETFTRGEVPCDIGKIDIDDMITFRVLGFSEK